MKKIISVLLFIIIFPEFCLSYAFQPYPGFTSTIVADFNEKSASGVGFVYFGNGLNSHIMPTDSSVEGGVNPGGLAVDTYYAKKPTSDIYLIQVEILEPDILNTPICELEYNALTETHRWIINRQYQPNKNNPPIVCKFYLYPHHMFISVTDK